MTIQSIQRAIDILSLFSHARPRWGITEIAQVSGLAKGTVHNIVSTLSRAGFLQQDAETRRYALGPNIFALGTIMAGTLDVNQKAAGPAHRLASQTGMISRVAIWDTDAALVTLNVTPDYSSSLSQQIGPRVVAYCSAIGRALLAHLPEPDLNSYLDRVKRVPYTPQTVTDRKKLLNILDKTRERGYAVNDQELAIGQTSIAAAIFQSGGRLAASISLTGRSDQVKGPELEGLVSMLRITAAEISRYLGHYPAAAEAPISQGFRQQV